MSKYATVCSETVWILFLSKLIKKFPERMHPRTFASVYVLIICRNTKENQLSYKLSSVITEYVFIMNNFTSKAW